MTVCVRGQTTVQVSSYTSGMNPEEREQMNWLCERIQIETNPHAFTNLVEQLNNLLRRKEKHLESSVGGKAEHLRLMAAELNAAIEATSAAMAHPKKS
jgi:hypothetical protein